MTDGPEDGNEQDGFAIVHLTAVSTESFNTCETAVRNLLNRTDEETHVWLAFGAPPVGTVDNFGSYELPEEDG